MATACDHGQRSHGITKRLITQKADLSQKKKTILRIRAMTQPRTQALFPASGGAPSKEHGYEVAGLKKSKTG